jgi:flagellar assembly factor FliW
MQLTTSRFGTLKYSQKEAMTLQEGLPGLEKHTRYLIVNPQESRPFAWLQSLTDSAVALPVIQPQAFLEDYQIQLTEEQAGHLELKVRDRLGFYCIITLGESLESTTVNLISPLVVNEANHRPVKISLERKPYSSRYSLLELLSGTKPE